MSSKIATSFRGTQDQMIAHLQDRAQEVAQRAAECRKGATKREAQAELSGLEFALDTLRAWTPTEKLCYGNAEAPSSVPPNVVPTQPEPAFVVNAPVP